MRFLIYIEFSSNLVQSQNSRSIRSEMAQWNVKTVLFKKSLKKSSFFHYPFTTSCRKQRHVLSPCRVSSPSNAGNPLYRWTDRRTDRVVCTRLKKIKRTLRENQPWEMVEIWYADAFWQHGPCSSTAFLVVCACARFDYLLCLSVHQLVGPHFILCFCDWQW